MTIRDSDKGKTSSAREAAAARQLEADAHKPVPLAPPYLTIGATAVWYEVMNAVPRDHFEPQDYRTLAAYCEACALVERLAERCSTEDPVLVDDNGASKQNPVFTTFKNTMSQVTSMALRLKLAPSTRGRDSAASKSAARASATARNSDRAGLLFDPARGKPAAEPAEPEEG